MKVRHTPRTERKVARFDPTRSESEEFVVEWDETDPDTEAMEAREDAMRAFGDRLLDD